jgi:hypothetical protein
VGLKEVLFELFDQSELTRTAQVAEVVVVVI